MVFDKTGTLTQGTFSVTAIHPRRVSARRELLELAALAESYSDHPISLSLQAACRQAPSTPPGSPRSEEIAGRGVQAVVDGSTVLRRQRQADGRARGVDTGDPCRRRRAPSSTVAVGRGLRRAHRHLRRGQAGRRPRPSRHLKAAGVRKTVMLTGDAQSGRPRRVAAAAGPG